jgi:hypothetical protein
MESSVRDQIRNSVRLLPTIARIRLLLELSKEELERVEGELAHLVAVAGDVRSTPASADDLREPVLLPDDRCPYSADELRTMRSETGGRKLSEILSGHGLS